MLNGFGQYRTEINGLGMHFLHVNSPNPDALPLILSHGWPGSVIEFHKVIGPLTDAGSCQVRRRHRRSARKIVSGDEAEGHCRANA